MRRLKIQPTVVCFALFFVFGLSSLFLAFSLLFDFQFSMPGLARRLVNVWYSTQQLGS
jgi:hypothetical protein